MYAITGATGNIGTKVVDQLLAKGQRVRVIGRNMERLQGFVDRGAEAAVGDLRNEVFLTNAFIGVDAAFAMIPPNYVTTDFRSHQNEIGEAISTAIMASGIKYVVNLSSQGADLPEGTGPIQGLHEQEQRLNRLHGVNIIHLRPTYFMENLLVTIPLIAARGVTGTALRGDLSFAMIATRDIAAEVAERLVTRDFEGVVIKDLLGERDVTMNEAFTIIGRKIGIPDLRYVQFPYDEAAKGMKGMGISDDVTRLFIEMSSALNNGLFAVNRTRSEINSTPTSIEEFAETFARVWKSNTLQKAA